jgi:hypothetical protein
MVTDSTAASSSISTCRFFAVLRALMFGVISLTHTYHRAAVFTFTMASNSLDSAPFATTRANVGDFTDSAAWSAETEVSASEVVEKQKVVK